MHAKTDHHNHAGYAGNAPANEPVLPVLVYWQALSGQDDQQGFAPHDDGWLTVTSQEHTFDAALRAACRVYPGHDLIMLRGDTALPEQFLQRLVLWRRQMPDTDAITVLSNAHAAFNPFGMAGYLPEPPADAGLDALVANTSLKRCYGVSRWPQHLLWLSASAAARLSESNRTLSDTLPERVGVRMLVADDMFARCASRGLFEPEPDYDWDLPPAFPAEYRQQVLQQLIADEIWQLPRIQPLRKPVILHITHSWGGGVARWVEDYCRHDEHHTHLVLQSRGFWKNKQYGTQLTLHQLQPDGPQLSEWWLTPGIFSTEIRNPQYQEILDDIQRCYRVSRVLVSSLIGHSLDALRCPLPTIQVLHDYYPAWPLLSVAPGGNDPERIDLARSLNETPPDQHEFADRDSRDWQVLTRSWMYHLRHPRVRMVAPTDAARRQLQAICPDAQRANISIIGHGLRDWQEGLSADIQSPPTGQDRPLRALVLGRLQQGKGRDLLLGALPNLNSRVHITALGCGKEGRVLLGHSNVDVIMQYDWHKLPALIGRIQPDVALLLSTVPETFSYTLSELQALNVPVIATRNGSFAERIEHGVTGLLVEPDSKALAELLSSLADNAIVLDQLRQRVQSLRPDDMQQMLSAYEQVWDSIDAPARPLTAALSKNDAASAQILNQTRLSEWRGRALRNTTDKLQNAYQEMSARLKQMRAQNRELNHTRDERNQLRQAMNHLTARVQQTLQQLQNKEQQLRQTQQHLDHLEQRLDNIINSRSWKLTKPLRLVSRFAYNFKLYRAYNPLRWPGLWRKLRQRWLRGGLGGALRSLQEVPEAPASEQYSNQQTLRTPIDWPTSGEQAGALIEPHTHIVLLEQQQLLPLAALLHQLQDVLDGQYAQLHLLHNALPQDVEDYLEECSGLHFYGSAKQLSKALQQAYENGEINQLLLVQGSIDSSTHSLKNLLDTGRQRPDAMLISALHANPNDPALHPLEAYSRSTARIDPALVLLRDSGVDGLLQSGFPKKSLSEALPGIAELVQDCQGLVWQQNNARYQLLSQPPEAVELALSADSARPAILVVDAWVPAPDKDSGSLRMTNLMRLLVDMGWHVVFCPLNKRHEGRYTENLQSLGVEVWYHPYLGSFSDFLQNNGQSFRSVILSRHQVAGELLKMVRRYCPGAQVIFDTVDLHYLREQREAELQESLQLSRIAEQTKRTELALIHKADLTLVVSSAEQELLADEAPGQRVEVLSNIHITHGRRGEFEEREDLLFVGGFQHPPNVDAVQWLCTSIWPLLAERLPDAKLHIIGSKMTDAIQAFASKRVLIHGYVEDLDTFHDHCRVSLAPLRYGAGVKGKINSAMSYGLPVVATTTAVEGMNLEDEQHVLIGDRSESFAAAVTRLYNDRELWYRLSDAGLENVSEHFSIEAAKKQLESILPKPK